MRIANTNKSREELIDFGSLDAGDVFWYNGTARMKLDRVIQHVHVQEDSSLEILDYDSVCLSDGTLCKHESTTPVRYQPQATVYLKG